MHSELSNESIDVVLDECDRHRYAVMFYEGVGRSTLCRTKTKKEAERRAAWYRKIREAGVPILEDTSVYD